MLEPKFIGIASLFGISMLILIYHLYFVLEDMLSRGSSNYINWMSSTQDRMFVKMSPMKCLGIIITSTALMGLFGFYFSIEYGFLNIIFTISFLFIGWNLPRFYINFKWKRRLETFDKQLIDALTLMSNSLKSNLNLNQVIAVVVREMKNPLSQEFGLVLSQHQLGLTIDDALEKMIKRVPTEDLMIVINSILILREKGGDISETFDTIASTIRERRKVEGKIKTVTAQGKMQSLLLFVMPFAIGAVLYFLNPDQMKLFLTNEVGWFLIGVMLLMQSIGGLWLRKIVDIQV